MGDDLPQFFLEALPDLWGLGTKGRRTEGLVFCWVLAVCRACLTPANSLNAQQNFARWVFLIQGQTAQEAQHQVYNTF